MAIEILASVGKNGVNRQDDVQEIQQALNKVKPDEGGPTAKLVEDGLSGPKTVAAITAFQQQHGLTADGRVDPGGQTLAKINAVIGASVSASIAFGPNANRNVVSTYTLNVLEDVLAAAGLTSLRIESTARTPEDQARIMFDNIETKGIKSQYDLYGTNGEKVIDVYAAEKKAGKAPSEIKKSMVEKILELGPANVSKHLSDPAILNVIDVAPSSISNKPAFVTAAKADKRISNILTPDDQDPAYHLEIPQPKPN
jgi:peptidoglycan hydrolase-like protein with peptidoglycan-binding domain